MGRRLDGGLRLRRRHAAGHAGQRRSGQPDSDGDTITDKLEKVCSYNPNVHSVLNVSFAGRRRTRSLRRPGYVACTATVKNELDNRIAYGLLEAELPTDNVQNTRSSTR